MFVFTTAAVAATACGPGLDSGTGTEVGAGGAHIGATSTGGATERATGGAVGQETGGATTPGTGGARGFGTGGNATLAGSGGSGNGPGAIPGTGGRRGTGGSRATSSGGNGAGATGVGATAGAGAGTTLGSGGSAMGGAPGGGGPSDGSAAPTMLPAPKETCPPFKTGNMTFLGQPVTIWAGTPTAEQHGPVVIYWFATGSSPQEAQRGLGAAAIAEITSQGGIVAAPGATSRKGTNTGNGVWFTGDFDTTDEVVACAIQQLHIDTRRIHAAGFSAGGLQTTWMSYARSGYLASVVPYSGGLSGIPSATTLQDASNVPTAMVVHGAPGSDVVILDFATASANYEADIKKRGGFSIDCNDGGGHMIPSALVPSTWTFMKAHPYKVSPKPYLAGGIPASFPTYCKIP